jgi:acyl-coenzyme A thioesterase PaaI-like protein
MITTLADFAMGYTTALTSEPPLRLVTLSLTVDFAGNAARDDWMEARVDVVRSGRRVAFVSAMVWRVAPATEERIARASATFLLLHPDE